MFSPSLLLLIVCCVILQDMYQYVFTIEKVDSPFTLREILPRQEIPLSKADNLLSDFSLKESTIMIEDAKEMDMDLFLDMIQEVKSI